MFENRQDQVSLRELLLRRSLPSFDFGSRLAILDISLSLSGCHSGLLLRDSAHSNCDCGQTCPVSVLGNRCEHWFLACWHSQKPRNPADPHRQAFEAKTYTHHHRRHKIRPNLLPRLPNPNLSVELGSLWRLRRVYHWFRPPLCVL